MYLLIPQPRARFELRSNFNSGTAGFDSKFPSPRLVA